MTNKLIRITTVPISLKTLLRGQHRFMSNYFEVIGVSSSGGFLEQVHLEEDIKVIPLEMSRVISPLKDLKSSWQFYKLCKKEKPFIVHSHTPKAGIVAMLASKLAGVPNRLHTVAGLPLMETTGIKRKILDAVEKLTYSCATKVYPNSKGLYDFILESKYTSSGKLKVIANGSSNGIDTSYFSTQKYNEAHLQDLKKKLNISLDEFLFIFVGRLVSDKGINELIEAFKQLSNKFAKVKLLFVGNLETDLDPLNTETLREIEQNNSIISVGYQNDVRPYFAIANALVFPSYREGFPNVVMQAGSMGLPSIVSNINGCNEIIQDGFNGLIIPVKDTDAIYAAMKRIVEDKNLYQNLQQNARKRIVDNYEQSVVWEAILAEYKSLENNV